MDLTNIPVEQRRKMLEVAREELLRQDRLASARQNLLEFCRFTMMEYEPGHHHRVLCSALERVARGECRRLMVTMPPRHGKSEIASRRFPAWYLGAFPGREIIAASYNADLASDFGRDVRNIVQSEGYKQLFPGTELAADSQAANKWHTSAGGVYVAAGVGGGLTGRGAHVLLIDDPVKDREDAESALQRQRVWDWYTSTAYTRLMPNGAVILIQTRWHTDDLGGRLLEAHRKFGGDEWELISMPAMGESGALWPEWFPEEELQRIRRVIGPRDWAALYQQTPIAEGKSEFKRDWLQWYQGQLTGAGMNTYIVVDPAGAKKLTSDRTAIWVVGLNGDQNYYLLDFVYDRLNLPERIREIMRLHKKWRPMRVGYEKYGKDSDAEALKMAQERDNYRFSVQELGGRLRKEDRIRRLQPIFEQGRVYLPVSMFRTDFTGKTVDLIDQFLNEEYDRFPVGKHDDGLDCLARILDDDLHASFPRPAVEHVERYQKKRFSGSAWAS